MSPHRTRPPLPSQPPLPPTPVRPPDRPVPPSGGDAWDDRSDALLDEPRPGPPVAADPATGPARPGPRGPADPVRALMHRHRELCERAVDPLEIAAGLEAYGLTDRTAARFRHRDVFSLAEELYARVPRGAEAGADEPLPAPVPAPHAPVLGLLPGGLAVVTAATVAAVHGEVRLAAAVTGVLCTAGALAFTLRRGPLKARRRPEPGARFSVCWLLAYALCGDGLLGQLTHGGPDGPWPLTGVAPVGLALAVAPAAWCARLFSQLARRKLTVSRSTGDFAAHTRPLVVLVTVLFATAPAALLFMPGFTAGAAALGLLLFVARLLVVHGYHRSTAAVLALACAAEALAPVSVLAARLPGFGFLALPVDALGPGAVPAVVCGAGALALLAHATTVLSRASAHP
ncbi:hypothetical protein [Streptomyces sp. NBC_00344]|uniref:hypothetical protein n=1 Tax=Streptomyces sp. NBC_00344 TaxID=2975720 RepID=UPI002E1C4882